MAAEAADVTAELAAGRRRRQRSRRESDCGSERSSLMSPSSARSVDFDAAATDETSEDPAEAIDHCVQMFQLPDFVMEPAVLRVLGRFCQNGGDVDVIADALSANYVAMAQLCNIMGGWLLEFESEQQSVIDLLEQQLIALINKRFRPKVADQFFYSSTAADMEWLAGLIGHKPWRHLIYSLAEKYPDCLLLNFAVKLCSDAGHQDEISNVQTAAQQLEIFSRVLRKAIDDVLANQASGLDTAKFEAALNEFVRTAGHSEATFVYTQCLLDCIQKQLRQTAGGVPQACVYLAQTLSQRVPHDTGHVMSALLLTSADADGDSRGGPDNSFAGAILAMQSMLSRDALNPADMQQLYAAYTTTEQSPPPLQLIRREPFLLLCIDALFRPSEPTKLSVERRQQYIYLLAYATAVFEEPNGGGLNKSDLPSVQDRLSEASDLCQGRADTNIETSSELLTMLNTIFQLVREPVVGAGVLHWVECVLSEGDYLRMHPEPVPVHLAIVDELATLHPLLHSKIFSLLTRLFVKESGAGGETLGEQLIERQKAFVDRLVHLLSCGHTLPVLEFVRQHYESAGDAHIRIDTSLIRYFVCEVLEIIAPPYSTGLCALLLPLAQDETIMGNADVPALHGFVEHCQQQLTLDASCS